jgi:hypothetical protein
VGRTAKVYINSVIAAGGLLLAVSLANSPSLDPLSWTSYLLLTVMASIVKLRLPGMNGHFSLSFLFLLYGIAHFDLPEILIAGCAGAVAGSLLNTKNRCNLVQVLFNTANLAISVGACFFLARVWLAAGMTGYLPAVIAVVACAYFIVNTVLVSGILSLLQGKRLAEVWNQWYVWSFPYYLIGVAFVGILSAGRQAVAGAAWLIILPLVYLVLFFLGLVRWNSSSAAVNDQPQTRLPRGAGIYVIGVVTSGLILLAAALFYWESANPARFMSYLALAVVASTLKVRLPRLVETITPAFVLVLVAIAQLSFAETVVVAALSGVVQVLWRSARRPMLAQIVFNPASLALSAALAYGLSRIALEPWLGHSVVGVLAVSTMVLYGSTTAMMATALALVNHKPLGSVWQPSCFWSLPYYLVGAAAAGVMTATSRAADWRASLLVLPLMGLVFISYRVHIRLAVGRNEQLAV